MRGVGYALRAAVSFRTRLALAAAAAVALAVVLASVIVFVVVRVSFAPELGGALRDRAEEIASRRIESHSCCSVVAPDLVVRRAIRNSRRGRRVDASSQGEDVPLPVNDRVLAVARNEEDAYLSDARVEAPTSA